MLTGLFLLLSVSVLPAVAIAAPLFDPRTDYSTGAGPHQAVTGQLDTDTYLDIVVANQNGGTVSVLRGNGDGTFQAKTDFGAGATPTSVALADFNGDGAADLAVTNFEPNTVSLMLGNGNATFQSPTTLDGGLHPYHVATADLNADGHPDLAVTQAAAISIFLGTGNGTFQPRVDYPTAQWATTVAIGDLSGDGKPDLAVVNNNSNSLSVLRGNGNGTFQPKTDYPTGSYPYSVAIGDLDVDGVPDLVVANLNSNSVSVFRGSGNGTFHSKTDYVTAAGPYSVAIHDLDRDGWQDVAVSASGANSMSVLHGVGGGVLGTRHDHWTGVNPNFLALSDLNGDGKSDIVVANINAHTVSVLRNISRPTLCTEIASDTTLTAADSPYLVSCPMYVRAGATLTIEAGVVLKLDPSVSIEIDGMLVSQGTPANPVVFTSYRDDEYGGDTNGDGSSVGQAGDWAGVTLHSGSYTLSGCLLRFGGRLGRDDQTVPVIHAAAGFSGTIADNSVFEGVHSGSFCYNTCVTNPGYGIAAAGPCTITGNSITYLYRTNNYPFDFPYGIQVSSAQAHIMNNTITKAGTGIRIVSSTGGEVSGNLINDPALGMSLLNSTGLSLSGNQVEGTAGCQSGIRIEGGSDCSVTGNRIVGAKHVSSGFGIEARDAVELTINENEFQDCNYGVNTIGGLLTIGHNQFLASSVSGYPYYLLSEPWPTFTGEITLGSGWRPSVALGGTIANDVLLDDVGGFGFTATTILGALEVVTRGRLRLPAGAILKFGPGARLATHSSGILESQGTRVTPVVLTSLADDEYGGDTNADAGRTTAQPGDWGGITLSDGDFALSGCLFRFGGQDGRRELTVPVITAGTNFTGTITKNVIYAAATLGGSCYTNCYTVPGVAILADGNCSIVDNTITYLNHSVPWAYPYGIQTRSANVNVRENVIDNAGTGIVIQASTNGKIVGNIVRDAVVGLDIDSQHASQLSVAGCFIADAVAHGIKVRSGSPSFSGCSIHGNTIGLDNQTPADLEATGNWWGDPSGPHDPSTGAPDHNPDGLGDFVSDFVAYRPWLEEPPARSSECAILGPDKLDVCQPGKFRAVLPDWLAGPIREAVWDFGDGWTPTGEVLTHVWRSDREAKDYSVQLTVEDAIGNRYKCEKVVSVSAPRTPVHGAVIGLDGALIVGARISIFSSELGRDTPIAEAVTDVRGLYSTTVPPGLDYAVLCEHPDYWNQNATGVMVCPNLPDSKESGFDIGVDFTLIRKDELTGIVRITHNGFAAGRSTVASVVVRPIDAGTYRLTTDFPAGDKSYRKPEDVNLGHLAAGELRTVLVQLKEVQNSESLWPMRCVFRLQRVTPLFSREVDADALEFVVDRPLNNDHGPEMTMTQARHLLETYQPAFLLNSGEKYAPKDVGIMFDHATLFNVPDLSRPLQLPATVHRGLVSLADAFSKPGESTGLDYLGDGDPLVNGYEDLSNRYSHVVYGTAVKQQGGDGLMRLYLSYWCFFFFESWEDCATHEGDWEGITLSLIRLGPEWIPEHVYYPHHPTGSVVHTVDDRSWDMAEKLDVNGRVIPKVYVALEAHGMYPAAGISDIAGSNCTDHHDGQGKWVVPEDFSPLAHGLPEAQVVRAQLQVIPRLDSISRVHTGLWPSYGGDYGRAPGAVLSCLAPKGPPFTGAAGRWTNPRFWTEHINTPTVLLPCVPDYVAGSGDNGERRRVVGDADDRLSAIQGMSRAFTIEIFDVMGRLQDRSSVRGSEEDWQSWLDGWKQKRQQAGFYFYRIRGDHGQSTTGRVVIVN